MDIGKMTITQALKYLKPIAKLYGLKLNRANDFRMARLICVNLYGSKI